MCTLSRIKEVRVVTIVLDTLASGFSVVLIFCSFILCLVISTHATHLSNDN